MGRKISAGLKQYLCLALGLLLNGLWLVGSLQAQEPPQPIDDYWAQLQASRDLLAQLAESEVEEAAIKPQLQAEAEHWANIQAVQLAEGTVIPVDHSFLVAQLEAESPDLARIVTLLDTLLHSRPGPQAGKQADLADLEKILAGAEFQWPEAESPSWSRQLWRRFLAWLSQFLPQLEGGEGGAGLNWLNYLLTALGTLLLALILLYVLRSLSSNLVADTVLSTEGDDGQIPLTADAALSQAQGLSSQGDYRTAVRYLYLSALLSLEEHGLLRYNRSLTNREYLRSVAHLPELAAILREVVDIFDRVWYGYQPLDQDDYNRYAGRVAELNRARPGRAGPGRPETGPRPETGRS